MMEKHAQFSMGKSAWSPRDVHECRITQDFIRMSKKRWVQCPHQKLCIFTIMLRVIRFWTSGFLYKRVGSPNGLF